MKRILSLLILLITLTFKTYSSTIEFNNNMNQQVSIDINGYEYVCMPLSNIEIYSYSGEKDIKIFDSYTGTLLLTTVVYISHAEHLTMNFSEEGIRYYRSSDVSNVIVVAPLHIVHSYHHHLYHHPIPVNHHPRNPIVNNRPEKNHNPQVTENHPHNQVHQNGSPQHNTAARISPQTPHSSSSMSHSSRGSHVSSAPHSSSTPHHSSPSQHHASSHSSHSTANTRR